MGRDFRLNKNSYRLQNVKHGLIYLYLYNFVPSTEYTEVISKSMKWAHCYGMYTAM